MARGGAGVFRLRPLHGTARSLGHPVATELAIASATPRSCRSPPPARSDCHGRNRRGSAQPDDRVVANAIVRSAPARAQEQSCRALSADATDWAIASVSEIPPVLAHWSRSRSSASGRGFSEKLPSGACWPALVRLTPGGVGSCNRLGAAAWPAPARRLLRLLKTGSEQPAAVSRLICCAPLAVLLGSVRKGSRSTGRPPRASR